jgi:hypothetical protein
MDREALQGLEAQAMSLIPQLIQLAQLASPGVLLVVVGYLYIAIDRNRANSTTKDDTQVGIKLVLFALTMVGIGLAAGGLQSILGYALGGFKGGGGPLKLYLPPVIVGAVVVLVMLLALLPRTNAATQKQPERFFLGILALVYGGASILSLNTLLQAVFTSAGWPAMAGAIASLVVNAAIGFMALIRFGAVSGWKAPVAAMPPP